MSHSSKTASPSFTASARKALNTIPPADFALPIEAASAAASPAVMLTSPPASAEAAPCPPALRLLHVRLGLAYRQPLLADAVSQFDLSRAIEREQRARVSHLDGAAHQELLHRARELEQAQQVARRAARAPDRVRRL